VVVQRAGQPVGVAGVGAGTNGSVEVSYALLPAGRGDGNATRAARLLAQWAHQVGAARVVLTTLSDNHPSARTAARAGFDPVGVQHRTVRGVDTELLLWQWSNSTGS